jgi:hypothetical protein
MRHYPVIGIAGLARTGKDTVASFLIAERHARYRYSFADPIKAMLAVGLGVDFNDPYWQTRKETPIPAFGKSPRQLMQTLGTEWGRQQVSDSLWIVLAKERLLQNGPGMVIADVRFDNEAEFVRSVGGVVLHVVRQGAEAVAVHASEGGVARMPADKVLINEGARLEDLHRSLRELFDQ